MDMVIFANFIKIWMKDGGCLRSKFKINLLQSCIVDYGKVFLLYLPCMSLRRSTVVATIISRPVFTILSGEDQD